MTDEQINQRIADACEWVPDCDNGICWDQHGAAIITPPNYCADLNAMHEAEKVLTDEHYMHFSDCLYDAEHERQNQTKKWRWLSTTARQRAEAFLRTLGKWEEVQK